MLHLKNHLRVSFFLGWFRTFHSTSSIMSGDIRRFFSPMSLAMFHFSAYLACISSFQENLDNYPVLKEQASRCPQFFNFLLTKKNIFFFAFIDRPTSM